MKIDVLREAVEDYHAWLQNQTTNDILKLWPDNPYVKETFALLERMANHCDEIANAVEEWQRNPNGLSRLMGILEGANDD